VEWMLALPLREVPVFSPVLVTGFEKLGLTLQ
jgi:hypothetical protein